MAAQSVTAKAMAGPGAPLVAGDLAVGIADLQAADDEEAPDQAVQGKTHGHSGLGRDGLVGNGGGG